MNTKVTSFSEREVQMLEQIEDSAKILNAQIGDAAKHLVHYKATSKLSVAHDRIGAGIARLGEAIDALRDDLPGGSQ